MNVKDKIKELIIPEPEDLEIVQINLDIKDITICDIFRNFNTLFPYNSQDRFEMRDGKKVYAIILRSVYLDPLTGIVLLLGNNTDINAECRNYVILSINERELKDEISIHNINEIITKYLIDRIEKVCPNFPKFFVKYVYNDYEKEIEE